MILAWVMTFSTYSACRATNTLELSDRPYTTIRGVVHDKRMIYLCIVPIDLVLDTNRFVCDLCSSPVWSLRLYA